MGGKIGEGLGLLWPKAEAPSQKTVSHSTGGVAVEARTVWEDSQEGDDREPVQ